MHSWTYCIPGKKNNNQLNRALKKTCGGVTLEETVLIKLPTCNWVSDFMQGSFKTGAMSIFSDL